MNGDPPFSAWLTFVDAEGDETRLDLVLVRGLDAAGGPARYHAMLPPRWAGVTVFGTVTCETSIGGELDPGRVLLDWPVKVCPAYGDFPAHAHLYGAGALQQTLS